MKRDILKLYAVTDRDSLKGRELNMAIEEALKGGVTCLQLREKFLSPDEYLEEAKKIRALCNKYNATLIINDNVEVAKASKAHGVHLGQGDMNVKEARKILGPTFIIGVSARTVAQAEKAQAEGADYIGAGAIFGTCTKKDAETIHIGMLKKICNAVCIPVVAIGGINLENMKRLEGIGISGIAVASSIFGADNIEKTCRLMKEVSL